MVKRRWGEAEKVQHGVYESPREGPRDGSLQCVSLFSPSEWAIEEDSISLVVSDTLSKELRVEQETAGGEGDRNEPGCPDGNKWQCGR